MKNTYRLLLCVLCINLFGFCTYRVPLEKLSLIDEAKITDQPKKTQIDSLVVGPEEICTTYEIEWAAGNKESLLLDPSRDVIFPGAVIKSESIQTGQFIPVQGVRCPIIISTTLPNLRISSDTIEIPENSSVTESINRILNSKDTGGVQPAEYALTVTDIKSQEDFNFKLNSKNFIPRWFCKYGI